MNRFLALLLAEAWRVIQALRPSRGMSAQWTISRQTQPRRKVTLYRSRPFTNAARFLCVKASAGSLFVETEDEFA
jgi:hypothetical protein